METNALDAERGGATCAVLVSGGLDSCILIAQRCKTHSRVWPLYVRFGYRWEGAEQRHLTRYLKAIARTELQPLQTLDMPARDLMPGHWSVTGRDVPDASSPDLNVYLPGRNVLLLSKAMIWCQMNGVAEVATATLAGNPFPDATDAFFSAFERVVNMALGGCVVLAHPFSHLHKSEVMRHVAGLPLALTFSCIDPVNDLHCGRCNKCAERRRAFADAGLHDHTEYACG